MPFPDAERVQYDRNPLIEVICQVRFPPVLRINSSVPADFQERIRASFPLFAEEEALTFPDLPSDLSEAIRASLRPQGAPRIWKFESADSTWTARLTRESIALSTHKYRRWEDFKSQFQAVFGALQIEYRPSFITRIGLRYQNQIVRSGLGLADVPWSDLLEEHVAAEFSSPNLDTAIQEAVHRVLIALPYHQSRVNLRHGIAQMKGTNEITYMIDNDFFTQEKTEVAHALERLELFHGESGRLFRWCITDRLHRAMGPVPFGE